MMKFVDISGFGHSGKGIITDLLREFDGYNVPHSNFEFNLIRINGGLLDLKNALVNNWSPIRADSAIRSFLHLIKRVGPSAKLSKPLSLFHANGMNYDNKFNRKFTELSLEYVNQLVNYTYKGEWPYPMITEPNSKQFFQRILNYAKIKEKFYTNVYVAAPKNFDQVTSIYLKTLFGQILAENETTVVMHNAIEPFNPTPSLDLFGNEAKVIIIQRDPRDIFASTASPGNGYIPEYEIKSHWQLKGNFLNIDNIERFIKRQNLYYDQVNYAADDNRVLRMRYEDVVINYEESVGRIIHFLGESSNVHKSKYAFFDPSRSKKNIGLWKGLKDQDSIKKIEQALPEYCYNL
jgi:hypothetical protein